MVTRGLCREGSKSQACGLCLEAVCEHLLYSKTFLGDIWYLELGTTTRFADVKGRTPTKNPGHKTDEASYVAFVDT